MSFIRPEVARWARQWRDLLIGLGVALVGVRLLVFPSLFHQILGGIILIGGAALAYTGVQRAMFRSGEGPGVVQVDEGRITYFGPLDGGSIGVSDLQLLEIEPNGFPSPHWALRGSKGVLNIPVDAHGADGLIDAFAVLPGLATETVLRAAAQPPAKRTTLWRRQGN